MSEQNLLQILNFEDSIQSSQFNFKDAVKVLTNFDVWDFNPQNDPFDFRVYDFLVYIGTKAVIRFNETKLPATKSANAVGIYAEEVISDLFTENNVLIQSPKTVEGKNKPSGYPDFEFFFPTLEGDSGQWIYLESKSFNTTQKESTFRTFYFSPSRDYKVARDSKHLLLGLEYSIEEDENGVNYYIAKDFHILSLEHLQVKAKIEFNASNSAMYNENNVIDLGHSLINH